MKQTFLFILISVLISIQAVAQKKKTLSGEPPGVNIDYNALQFRSIGPALTSGRISDIAIHPQNRHIWYVAVGSGGVWKTLNSGTTWKPVFDGQASYSIGCLTIDAKNPEVIWVGTGENVSGRHVGFGDGVYKSLNGGKTWENMGLLRSEHIGAIALDPRDSDVVFVAAEGPLWSPGGERGLFKSSDGGRSWRRVLYVSADTGVTDVDIDPENPDIIYAAAYQRRRSVAAFMGGGPDSGIYKSIDGGGHWKRLSVGLPLGSMGKISLALSYQDHRVVYATIEAGEEEKGFYRSADQGESWEKRSAYISGGTGPHYYQEIFADPHHFDRVYQMDVWLHKTDDGGHNFSKVGEAAKHSDNHALAFFTGDPDYLLSGCDGGIYESFDMGKTWKFAANLPVTQFYKLALDNTYPFYNLLGGTQDNGTLLGPSRTLKNTGIVNSDWIFVLGADGYSCAFDPSDPNILYAEWQVGNLVRYDRRNGETVSIQPKPEPGEAPERWNWDAPILISPHSPSRIYFASQRLYCSEDRGDSWKAISTDLTRGIFRLRQPIMGKTWGSSSLWDHNAMSHYGTITAVSESPIAEGLIYVGTDDGLIQVTENSGQTWRKIEALPDVPSFSFVNEILACLHDPDTVFVALDNHKNGDYRPFILKSTDRGRNWQSITGGIPERHLVWSLAQDHIQPEILFAGTEFGIFFTPDGGGRWIPMNGNLPAIPFRDIAIQRRENDLIGASFGRGFFILDDYSPLRRQDSSGNTPEGTLYPVRKALMYIPQKPLDLPGKAFQGDAFYSAPNPPLGAVFTYYLRNGFSTEREDRKKREEFLEKRKENSQFPEWEVLERESLEERPAVILTVRDQAGNVVRRLEGPVTAGLHRVSWDMRYPSIDPVSWQPPSDPSPWDTPPQGPLVAPGDFSFTMEKRTAGRLTMIGVPQSFRVESMAASTLSDSGRRTHHEYLRKAGELQRMILETLECIQESQKKIELIKKALEKASWVDQSLHAEAIRIEGEMQKMNRILSWDPIRGRFNEPSPPSILERIDLYLSNTSGITSTSRRGLEIAGKQFEKILETLHILLEKDLPALEKKLDQAGAPWTPGRPLPKMK